jgi:hypothetical protein
MRAGTGRQELYCRHGQLQWSVPGRPQAKHSTTKSRTGFMFMGVIKWALDPKNIMNLGKKLAA